MGQDKKPLPVAGTLVQFPSLSPCWASSKQMGGGTICPQLTFQVVLWFHCGCFSRLQFARPSTLPSSQVRWDQQSVGARPLPQVFLCSGCTSPHTSALQGCVQYREGAPSTPLPPITAFSTRWLPAGREQYFPKHNLYVIRGEAAGVTLGPFAGSKAGRW